MNKFPPTDRMLSFFGAWLVLAVIASVLGLGLTQSFPDDFMFGAGTSAYQIEGAWNEDGKGESIWDHMLHEHPEYVLDGSNGDVVADSYHKYMEDVAIAKDLNLTHYRFSLSWSRILPTGDIDVINQPGIDYYNRLIDALLENGIQPLVTLYVWDLPQKLQNVGGWTNEVLVDYFVEYARVAFQNFGDRVKWWTTFNEPLQICAGYAGVGGMAPSMPSPGIGEYLAGHTVLKAHAKAFHLYDQEFRPSQQGKVSIILSTDWDEPASNSSQDVDAADRARDYYLGRFAHPIFSSEGDYPPSVRKRIDDLSASEGRPRSRLPRFTPEEVSYVRGTADFFSINTYTTVLHWACNTSQDIGVCSGVDPSWPGSASDWLKVVPWGLRRLVNWITRNYPGYPILVSENGFSDHGEIEDLGRVDYITSYLSELLGAITEDGANVFGYTFWSLLDNLEWNAGFTQLFGLYHVDFEDPERPRRAKASATVYKDIIASRQVPVKSTNI